MRTTSRRYSRSSRKRPAATSAPQVAVGRRDDPHVDRRAVRSRRRAGPRPPEARAAAWPARAATARRPRRGTACRRCASSNTRPLGHRPVNAPRACPNSSASTRSSGSAAQLSVAEAAVAPRAAAMERPRHQLLADAALAFDQHGERRRRRARTDGGAARSLERQRSVPRISGTRRSRRVDRAHRDAAHRVATGEASGRPPSRARWRAVGAAGAHRRHGAEAPGWAAARPSPVRGPHATQQCRSRRRHGPRALRSGDPVAVACAAPRDRGRDIRGSAASTSPVSCQVAQARHALDHDLRVRAPCCDAARARRAVAARRPASNDLVARQRARRTRHRSRSTRRRPGSSCGAACAARARPAPAAIARADSASRTRHASAQARVAKDSSAAVDVPARTAPRSRASSSRAASVSAPTSHSAASSSSGAWRPPRRSHASAPRQPRRSERRRRAPARASRRAASDQHAARPRLLCLPPAPSAPATSRSRRSAAACRARADNSPRLRSRPRRTCSANRRRISPERRHRPRCRAALQRIACRREVHVRGSVSRLDGSLQCSATRPIDQRVNQRARAPGARSFFV